METMDDYIKGRGAQTNPHNQYHNSELVFDHIEGLDEYFDYNPGSTKYYIDTTKAIVNKVDSPDVGAGWSMNPYRGCEHGCIYCYARNSHEYWGFSAGIDFESKIMIKPSAPELLKLHFMRKNYKPEVIMLSGNTDCYQPVERKMEITRNILKVFLECKHPVGIITKNAMVLRDLDILKELAAQRLVRVAISITTLDNDLQHRMEPRTSLPSKRLDAVHRLSEAGVPVMVMQAPVIPWLTDMETPKLIKACAEAGAYTVHHSIVRLNGSIGGIFTDWVQKNYPLKAEKILNAIRNMHDGKLSDSRFGRRMTGGDTPWYQVFMQQYDVAMRKHFKIPKPRVEYNYEAFIPPSQGQMRLF
ncbi:PA0069 family radical SAM protein [soil metagenome]